MRLAGFLAVLIIILAPSYAHSYEKFAGGADFIKEFPAGNPIFLVVDDTSGRIYTTQVDGTVKVFDLDGNIVQTIKERTSDRTRVLRKPTGIALYKDRVYVADAGLSAVSVFRKDGSFIESFGSSGDGPKEFNSPQGIRVEEGVVYVADWGNARVQLFGLDGVFLRSFGTEGSQWEVLKAPADIALPPNGDIYVADTEGRNVKMFGPDLKLRSRAERVAFPFSLTLFADGFLVSDTKYGRVTLHDSQGHLLFGFGSKSAGPQWKFENVRGIYLDSKLNLYVADMDGGSIRIYKMNGIDPARERQYPPPTSVGWVRDIDTSAGRVFWDERGKTLYAIDERDRAVLLLKDGKVKDRFKVDGWRPSGMAIDQKGALWVSDRAGNRLLKLGPDGKVVSRMGSSGSAEGRFNGPEDIAITKKGTVYVADTGNERIEQFNAKGMFLRVLGKGGTSSYFQRPVSLALDQDDILYVLDAERKEVLVFSPDGLPLNDFGKDLFDGPVDIAVNGEEVFVLDAGLGQVLVFDHRGNYVRRFGAPGSQKGDLRKPRSLDTMGMTRVFISDTGNDRIQELHFVYTPDILRSVRAEAGMREVTIEWKPAPEAYVERYIVYRSPGQDGPYEQVAETSSPGYTDLTIEPGDTYYYRVTAVATDGNESPGSRPVSASPEKYTPDRLIGVNAEAGEDSITVSWRKSKSPFVTDYVVYRKPLDGPVTKVGETHGTEFVDSGLNSSTSFTYMVAARSIDGQESVPVQIQATTQVPGGSPLKIKVVKLVDVLSNAYRLYEHDGMGRIRLENATDTPVSQIQVLFKVNGFMDAPAVLNAGPLAPGESRELVLKPAFNDKIHDVDSNTVALVEVTALYYHGGQDTTAKISRTVDVYEKHYTTWDEDGRIATFVTPDDPVVGEFTRSLLSQYTDTSNRLVLGGLVFDALGSIGTSYQPDREQPYQEAARKAGLVDRVQFPRDTLRRKVGDTDDLVSLYVAALESMGTHTRVLLYPGHAFMMFSIGFISETGGQDLDGKLINRDGRVWVPVEVTLIGSSFLKAWEKGLESYTAWEGKGLRILDLRAAWERFEPASLRTDEWRPPLVIREQVDQRFPADLRTLVRYGVRLKTEGYARALRKNPNDTSAMLHMGVLYAEAGEMNDASRLFEKAATLDRKNAALKNNIGNMKFLKGEFDEACILYRDAVSLDAGDALAWVNLARCLTRIERYREATDAFRKAYELDKSVPRTYRRMSIQLLGGF